MVSKIRAKLNSRIKGTIEVAPHEDSIMLTGICDTIEQKVQAGWIAAKYSGKEVINEIMIKNAEPEKEAKQSHEVDRSLEGKAFDVVIIGGGIIGCAIARELSRYTLRIAVFEKEYDVAVHTSSRNDGMIHDGFAAKPGTKKARYNVRGNELWEPLANSLKIGFKRVGSLVLFSSPQSALLYPVLAERARKNKVAGWEFWSRSKVKKEEPYLSEDQHGAFYLPSAGILSPYRATVALAEHAIQNGVDFFLSTRVLSFGKISNRIQTVQTSRGTVFAGLVINASGLWSDKIAEAAGDKYFTLHFRKGTDLILDKNTGVWQKHVAAMPRFLQIAEKTKGGGLVPTIEGNVLVGPTAREIMYREDYSTQQQDIQELEKHIRLNTKLSLNQVITYFSGVRACTYSEDFIVEQSKKIENLIHVAGIQSPGLASAPAIAEDVKNICVKILKQNMRVEEKNNWINERSTYPDMQTMTFEERAEVIKKNPGYGKIVCRCEAVSEQEIRDVLQSPLPVIALDAIKRRVRPGAGRCHGGFCTPRVMEILAAESGSDFSSITKKGNGSEIVTCALEECHDGK